MSIKLLAGVAVIAAGVGLSGPAPVHAAPTNPLTPCSDCLPGPGGGPGGHAIGIPGTPVHLPMTGRRAQDRENRQSCSPGLTPQSR